MRKAYKNISYVSMWIAAAALWAHMIVPHDHHIAETFSDQEQSCPASHQQSGHTSGFPVHCHAFNDLASERVRIYLLSQIVQVNFIALSTSPDHFIFRHQDYCSRIIDLQNPIVISFPPDLSLLRAPPSLV